MSVLDAQQAASYLSGHTPEGSRRTVGPRTVRRLMADGDLGVVMKHGKRNLTSEMYCDAWLAGLSPRDAVAWVAAGKAGAA